MAKNLTKEQLETDVLVTGYARAVEIYHDHGRKIIFGTLTVLLIIGASIGWYITSERNELKAQELLVHPERYFEQGEYDLALHGNLDLGHSGFVSIISNYGRTNAGNIARYYAAVSEVRSGNHQEALFYIERYKAPKGILGVGPVALHAAILGSLERFEDAAQKFELAANWDVNESTTPQNLLNAAQAYYEAGQYNQAKKLAEQIIKEYGTSSAAQPARNLLGMLAVR